MIPPGLAFRSCSCSTNARLPHSAELMMVLDEINNSGLGKVWFAGRGMAPEWQMKREMLSPAYTTRWSDIPAAKLA